MMSSIIQRIDNLAVVDTSLEGLTDVESTILRHLDDQFKSWEDLVEPVNGHGGDGKLKLEVEEERWQHELESAETEVRECFQKLFSYPSTNYVLIFVPTIPAR